MIETIQEERAREEREKENREQDKKCKDGKHIVVRSSNRGTFCEHCDEPL